jgi:hypothetical protein
MSTNSEGLQDAYLIITTTTVVVLLGAYAKTLYNTCKGSKYKFVQEVLIMLLISNFGTLMLMFSNYELFVYMPNHEPLKEGWGTGYVWMLGFSIMIQDSMFSVSHLLLAQKYKNIAQTMPYLLQRKRPPPEPLKQLMIYSLLVTMNILFPVMECVFLIPYNKQVLVDQQAEPTKTSLTGMVCFVSVMTGVLQLITGAMLLSAVKDIKKIFKTREKESFLNMQMVYLHSIAFLLFMLASAFNYTCMIIYFFNTQGDTVFDLYTWGCIVQGLTSFVAQMFLVVILWDLGKGKRDLNLSSRQKQKVRVHIGKQERIKMLEGALSSSDMDDINKDSFTMEVMSSEDIHLQTRMWNKFVKKKS